MTFRRLFVGSILLLSGLFVGVQDASACSCGPAPTVLESYEGSEVVAVLKVMSVEKATEGGSVPGVGSAVLEVTKVYKGSVRPGNQLTFAQGGGGSCTWAFGEAMIGHEYLLYLRAPEKADELWVGVGCGRSRNIESATDDLLYLDNLAKVRGRTRVSGTIWFDRAEDVPAGGIGIRLIAGKRIFRTKTESHGVYEFYDVPAGKYLVEFDSIKGWKFNPHWLRYSRSADRTADPKSIPPVPITVADKQHASLDLYFDIDNAIRGRVVDPNGNPMQRVCVDAVDAVDPNPTVKGGSYSNCTTADGSFALTTLPRGNYLLLLNSDGKIDANEPFKTFYYPGVAERSKATVLYVGPGEFIDGITIAVPEVAESITVRGRFLYSDGNPVVEEHVGFRVLREGDSASDEDDDPRDAGGSTNEKGEFSFKILKGLRGTLSGGLVTYSGEFRDCPALEKLIRTSGEWMPEIETPAIEIQADNDLFDLVVRFPFPRCEKVRR